MNELAKLKKELKDLCKLKEIEKVKAQIKEIKHPSQVKAGARRVGDFFRPRGNEKEKLKDLISF